MREFFSETYHDASRKFMDAVDAIRWEFVEIPFSKTGPDGEQLRFEVAMSPNKNARNLLVITSGVHGVEGFLGSAVQIAAMQDWIDVLPENVRCLFLHNVNPYGFAHLRRFNESNVDPNRNFLIDEQQYSGAPEGYAELDSFLNPQSPPAVWEPFLLKALWKIQQHGMPTLKQAIAAGQYEFPQGLFFGGKELSESGRILESNYPQWFAGAERVVHLDFHTGLGKSGECHLLIETALTESQQDFLAEQFGPHSYQQIGTEGVAYEAKGGYGTWSIQKSGVHDYLFACAEFGTYGPIPVLAGLRAENRAHHWGDPESPKTVNAKKRLKELFCPSSSHWRTTVINRSQELIQNAISGLQNGTF